jgi:DNA-binding response OmpR family regulator
VIIARILIVSDEQVTAEITAKALERRRIGTEITSLDRRAVQLCTRYTYDLVIVDISNHFSDTFSICRRIRAAFDGPVMVLTYETDERLHLKLYDVGIDESVAKPIGIPLLCAKVRVWVDRAFMQQTDSSTVKHVDFELGKVERILTCPSGKAVKLSKLEYRLAYHLLTHRGRLVASDSLIEWMWREFGDGDIRMLKSVVYRLRQKIEPNPNRPQYLETVAGFGYRIRSG